MLNNYSKTNKIGIFDSGIGGLTVARAIYNVLPHENLLYIGDTAHMPWGDKSKSQIISYATKLTNFLIEKNCNIVVVACNTASCVTLEKLSEQFTQIKLFNVIDPIILFLQQIDFNNFNSIGIIGTKRTIHSEAYQNRIEELQPHLIAEKKLQIKALATPLLVPLIEEGLIDNQATDLIITQYLSQLDLEDKSILILGCTHYPLIKKHIDNYYIKLNKQVVVIDSTLLVANQIKDFLLKTKQINATNPTSTNNFYCTDNSEFFFKTAKQLFANITLDFLPLWE